MQDNFSLRGPSQNKAFFGVNDSLFTNINKFQSISNILDSFLDLFCDWLCKSHMINSEPWRVHLNALCIKWRNIIQDIKI